MQSIVSAAWHSDRRPLVSCTIGDLAWWVAGAGPGAALHDQIRIWSDDQGIVGWAWYAAPSSIDWFVRMELDEGQDALVRDEIVGWLTELAGRAEPRPERIAAWAADGWREAEYLGSHGFVPADESLTQFHQPLDGVPPDPILPAGYTIRTVAGPEEIPARVEVHRKAFAPSKMTVEKHGLLVGLDPYSFDRDIVAVAPDGSFAAFTICWLDEVAGVGEFEPVGTDPGHQRRGLGKAVLAHGLRLFQSLGVRDVIVFSERSNAASEGLYRSAGFAEIAVHRKFTRPLSA